jgi:hypothetical protein
VVFPTGAPPPPEAETGPLQPHAIFADLPALLEAWRSGEGTTDS